MKKKITIIILILLIIGLIIWDTFFRIIPTPVPITYNYVTDTIRDSIPYKVPEPYPVPTPPVIITYYETDSSTIKDLQILLSKKEVIIAGLQDSVKIHQNYLKQYPTNPKLLSMDLKRDSLRFGLLSISGQVEERNWPIDLNQFNYRWNIESDLSRHSTTLPPIERKPFAEYFVGGGYDILYSSPYLSGRIEKNWTRIRLYGDTHIGLLKKESSEIKIGAEYKFKWLQK